MSFDSRDTARRITPREGDSLETIAAREGAADGITAEDIARFNWGATPEQVNEFLRDELGARLRDENGDFLLSPQDQRRSELLLPRRFRRGFETGKTHTLRLAAKSAPPQFVECCSIPGVTFEFDKSFIRPSVVDTLKELKVLADTHPDTKIMIWGHTDKVGSEQYNKLLSERRAKSVFAFITNDVNTWEALFNQENWGKSATDQMLADEGFDPATNANAVKDYQTARGLNPDGVVGPNTRKQLFTDYMTGKHDLDLPPERFMDPKFMGCGEFNPQVETEEREEQNRRVTFFLFNKDRLPKLPCPTAPGDIAPCKKQIAATGPRTVPTFKCSFFDSIASKCKCENPVPPVVTRKVHLRLRWNDPDNTAHDFPETLPIRVVFDDNGTQDAVLEKDGRVSFDVPQGKKSFTLRFQSGNERFIATAGASSTAEPKERAVFRPEVKGLMDQGFRVWSLPSDWVLGEADWKAAGPDAGAFDAATAVISGLDDTAKSLGQPAAPIELTLDPHWQFLRFTYFDRTLRKKMSILPIMIEGFHIPPLSTNEVANTRSNWTTGGEEDAKQCLPWVLQRKPGAGMPAPTFTAAARPDTKSFLRFRAVNGPHSAGGSLFKVPGTFIESSAGGQRKLITVKPSDGSDPKTLSIQDPGRNTGEGFEFNLYAPSAGRLRFYDLPNVWECRGYFCKLGDAAGAKEGFHKDLATEATTAAAPLTFCLDDIVLTTSTMNAIDWDPAKDTSRVAIFSHRFSDKKADGTTDGKLSPSGVFDPDNPKSWFTKKPKHLENKVNYLSEYPDWTRLVIAAGNMHDAFDLRTVGIGASIVVGARAAVRWVDSAAISKPHNNPARPGTTRGLFFAIRPFFQQKHPRFEIGRYDMSCLRCCDVDSDTEIGVALQYFRYFHLFNTPAGDLTKEQKANGIKVSTATGAAADNFVKRCCENIATRWNGPEGTFTAGPTEIIPVDANIKFRARAQYFIQDVPSDIAHFEVRVFEKIRASMGGQSGTGQVADGSGTSGGTDNSQPSSFFTAAHETGHSFSLEDEYIEETMGTSVFEAEPTPFIRVPGFTSFIPGAPFYDDIVRKLDTRSNIPGKAEENAAMMRANAEIRARYCWHVAEWLRSEGDPTKIPYQVSYDGHKYKILAHPKAPTHTHQTIPLAGRIEDETKGDRGKYDVILYHMGEDKYTKVILPNSTDGRPATLTGANFFDGMILVEVRLRFKFKDTNKVSELSQELNLIHLAIKKRYNNRMVARGAGKGVTFQNCLIHFTPRFLVRGHSDDDPSEGRHFDVEVKNSGNTVWDDGVFGKGRDLIYVKGQIGKMLGAFAEMIGIDDGKINDPEHYRAIVNAVLPGAAIAQL